MLLVFCLRVFCAVMCIVLLAFCALCVLIFSTVIIYGVEYRILEIKQYFVPLFILLVSVLNMEFFQGCSYISASLCYFYYFRCVMFVSVEFPMFSICCT